MPSAKDLEVRPISPQLARRTITRLHYSKKPSPNAFVHLGVFLGDRLVGAVQLGTGIDARKTAQLVTGSARENFLELGRLALVDDTPRNSESRLIAIVCRMLKQYRPQTKWLLTYADATQCGDGTIYRAAGFDLIGIKKNVSLLQLPDGTTIHEMALKNSRHKPRPELGGRSVNNIEAGWSLSEYRRITGAKPLPGFQIRYIKFLDASWRKRLAVPVLPYESISDKGAAMYRGRAPEA